jgi:hypothetical protein
MPVLQNGLDLTNFDSKFVKFDVKESMVPEEDQKKIIDKNEVFE